MRRFFAAGLLLCVMCPALLAQTEPPAPTPPPAPAPTQSQPPAPQPTTVEQEVPPLTTSTPAKPYPRLEIYGGYSFVSSNVFAAPDRGYLNGWNAALDVNALRWLSLVAEFGGSYGTSKLPSASPTPFPPCPPFCPGSPTTFDVKTKLTTYMFGVHLPYRKWDKFTPYIGAVGGRAAVTGRVPNFRESDNKLGLAAGAGADFNLSKTWAWRVQADYLQTKVFGRSEGSARFQAGIVWRPSFEKKKKKNAPDVADAP